MDFSSYFIKNRIFAYVITVVILAFGFISYEKLGKLEDPEFTIKDALIITSYPGASAQEVEEEVTDKLEEALQRLGQLKKLVSKSSAGLSIITVSIKDNYRANRLPQVWDEVRRKVASVQNIMPPGVNESIVKDDYGDVFGMFLAIYGKEYSNKELKDYVDILKKELILVKNVGKVNIFSDRREIIYIELNRDRLAKLGISKNEIIRELQNKNIVTNAGSVNVGSEYIRIRPTGSLNSVKAFENIIIRGRSSNAQIFLKDIATIKRDYQEPQTSILTYDGNEAIGLGISTVKGGNVLDMGAALNAKLLELKKELPLGMHIGMISNQAKSVDISISTFINNLLAAIFIVVAVLLLFMGLRSGLIIGFVLVLTILGTFIFMLVMGIQLERISLGALIIALGMLVDNAIVIIDGMLLKIQKGDGKEFAASEVIKQTSTPLFAATIIAIMAFGAIGTLDNNTGEFCKSLFQVVAISLSFSWITAVTITPLLGVQFLKAANKDDVNKELFTGKFYSIYGSFLKFCINKRWFVIIAVIVLFLFSLSNFKYVKKSFFPDSTRPQIMLDFWMPQGSKIQTTADILASIRKDIQEVKGVTHITSITGKGSLRFILTYAPQKGNSAYGQMLIDIKDFKDLDKIIHIIDKLIKKDYPNIRSFGRKFVLGPGAGGKLQVKIFGKDENKIRFYEKEVNKIFASNSLTKGLRSDWKERVKVIRPVILDQVANLNGISRSAIANAIRDTFEGRMVGVYREHETLIPIVLRAQNNVRSNINSLNNIQIFSPVAGKNIPLRQVISHFETINEDDIIYRYNRQKALTVHADVHEGVANDLLFQVKPLIDSIKLEDGYRLEWHGEYRDTKNSQGPIIKSLPMFMLIMILIKIALFNSLKKPLIIWLIIPFALIGVVWGLLITDKAFGFMSLLGFLSLSGMLIKNAIVLIDEITMLNEHQGKSLEDSILEAGMSRLRPVAMAALTTALGMIPLIFDAFFGSMAVSIVFGLMVATVLIVIMVPVLYAIFFKAGKYA